MKPIKLPKDVMLVSLASEMSNNIKACNFGSARNISTYPYICQVWLKKNSENALFIFVFISFCVSLFNYSLHGGHMSDARFRTK